MTGVRWVARISLLIALCLLAAAARAQTGVPNLEPNRKLYTPVPTITFTYALEGAQPGHYSISLESSGKAAYQAEEIPQDGTVGAPYNKKFITRHYGFGSRPSTCPASGNWASSLPRKPCSPTPMPPPCRILP